MAISPDIPNLRHLRILLTVAQVRSVSRASERINMSQPAVTQAIAKMEAEYGLPLFERRSTGSFPTHAGGRLIQRIERFFEIADAAVRMARNTAKASDAPVQCTVDQLLTATQIRAFLATMDRARTSQIADELGISITSLVRSSREMEKALKRPLFRRTPLGIEGNNTGNALARSLGIAVSELEYGRQELFKGAKATSPTVSVGVLPMTGSFVLASAVTALMQSVPDVRVIVLDGTYHDLLDGLRSGKIDMIFGLLRCPAWVEDLIEEPLFEDTFCVVGRRGHPLARLPNVTKEDLAAYNWIVPAPGTPRRLQIDHVFAEMDPVPRLGIETSSLATMRALILGSDLLTVMSSQEVDFEERTGMMATLNFKFPSSLPPKGITVRRNWLPTETHSRFISLLRQHTTESYLSRGSAHAAMANPIALVS